jgi:hypothetical protein
MRAAVNNEMQILEVARKASESALQQILAQPSATPGRQKKHGELGGRGVQSRREQETVRTSRRWMSKVGRE